MLYLSNFKRNVFFISFLFKINKYQMSFYASQYSISSMAYKKLHQKYILYVLD